MPTMREMLDLEELVITVYAALDDALAEAGITARAGKLVPRPGPAPDVDDREILCLAVLQELLGFESDHGFYQWFESNTVLRRLFPRRLSRPNWADRRALLMPLLQRLSQAFCALDGELFLSLSEARYVADRWRMDYNRRRPHSRLNWMTPAALAASCPRTGRPATAGEPGAAPGSATPQPPQHT